MRNDANVLVAGAGGVLGRNIVEAFYKRGVKVIGLGLGEREFDGIRDKFAKTVCCNVADPGQLRGACRGADIVISCIGINRLKGKLSHMDVDYRGNLNLLKEAQESGVKKFVFISPAGVDLGHRHVPLFKAKHLFEQELKKSGLKWLIFRSGGFFRDLAEMGKSASKGMMFVIGSGRNKFTPIDVRDLAEIMAEDSLDKENQLIEAGGPDDMSWKEICYACFESSGRKARIIHCPVWMCKFAAFLIRPFSRKYHAMARLILFTSLTNLPTRKRGRISFQDYLREQYSRQQ
ncbi:MAG: SDR family oxidoreductase [Candidatus Omnitrophota bacterium]